MKMQSGFHLSRLRPDCGGWTAAWLRLSLLLALVFLGACDESSSPSQPTPTGRPATHTTVKPTTRPATRSAAVPSQTATVEPYPYPPANTQPAYPAEASPAATPSPTQAPDVTANVAGPYIQYLPYLSAIVVTPAPTPLPSATPQPQRPEPTDTPRPPWPAPLSGQTTSKLGLHVIAVYPDPDIMEFVNRVHPRVAVSPSDVAGLAQIKAASPGTVTISRKDVAGQGEWRNTMDAATAANHYVEANLGYYRQNPAVDYWEGMNEPAPDTPDDWAWFTQFEAARACAMQAQGLRAAIGAFAVGWPRTFDEMTSFLPALEAAHRCGGILTIHEYNGPTMDCGVATNVPNIIPGAPALSVPAGIFTLRYRILYEGLLKPRGLGDLPLAITELGADGSSPKDPCQGPGHGWTWKRYQPSWIDRGLGPTGAEAYVNVLAWYDAEIKKDPYIIGAAIFTAGEFATTAWANFDIHEALIQLATYEVRP
jgi:hypothetical protein